MIFLHANPSCSLFLLYCEQYGGAQDVLVGEIQAPYDLDLVGEALLHATDDRRDVGQLEALRTFDGDYRSRDLIGRDARIMEPSVERLHDARRRPAFHADDRGQGAGADASDVVPIDVDVLVVAEESLQRRDGIVIVVAGSSPGTGRRSTSTRSVASVPAAGMRTVSSRAPSFSFHRILTTWLPSVLSVASMCRAVIFGSFSMRRVRFFPGHVPAVLTSVDAGRACGPIGASANQDGGRHGRRGSATSPKNVTDPRRNPDTRFAAEDDGGRGIGAVLAGHDGRRGLCESAMPWLASYV